MIEHPNPRKATRVAVRTPWEHHKQLLAWKLPGLDPVPDPPESEVARQPAAPDTGYPRMIQNEKSGQRVRVDSVAEHDLRLAEWAGKATTSTARRLEPLVDAQKTPANKGNAGNKGKAGKGETRLQPPTVEDLMKKNFPKSIAQRMADEEVRKYNAGEAPYDQA
jgi:hypothetical protein